MMRPSIAPRFPTALAFGILLTIISAQSDTLTLSDKQPINGFDAACTKAYNTPLTDCSNSDFTAQGCSNKCIGFLDSLQTTMMTSCAGTNAYYNTLIGLFLAGQGVHTLCSNVPSGGTSSSGSGAGNGQSGAQAGASVIQDQSAAGYTSTSTTSTSISTTSTTYTTSTSSTPKAATTSSTSTSSNPQAAATTSTTTVVPITVTPEATTTSVAIVGTTVVPASPADTSTSTSHTKSSTSSSTTSTSTNNGNGGGTPLDISSSATRHGAVLSMWLSVSLAGSAAVIWLL